MKLKQSHPSFFVVVCISILSFCRAAEADDPLSAYDYMNELRLRANMERLLRNNQLEQAATNHAIYLDSNGLTGHSQVNNLPQYTGVSPADRAAYVGYPSQSVLENVSSGQYDFHSSIDDLMSAIYHRFTFLDASANEIGLAKIDSTIYRDSYVYEMGNSFLREVCTGEGFSGHGTYYTHVCSPDFNVSAEAYEEAQTTIKSANPELVVWPVDGELSVPPVFYEESPDPLPDYSASGYPISIQFNDYYVSSITVTSFKLFKAEAGEEVLPTRLLDMSTDPNGKFSEYQFALFPLERLDWQTDYSAEVTFTADGQQRKKNWSFRTSHPGVQVFQIMGNGDSIQVGSGSQFAVYIAPSQGQPTIGRVSSQYTSGTSVDMDFYDLNTMTINISGPPGGQANFITPSGLNFSVTLTSEEPLPPAMDISTEEMASSGLSSCASIDSDLNILLPCVEAAGEYYQVTLNRINNSDTPPESLYWELGNIVVSKPMQTCTTVGPQLTVNIPCVNVGDKILTVELLPLVGTPSNSKSLTWELGTVSR